jgi:hypothetical protein
VIQGGESHAIHAIVVKEHAANARERSLEKVSAGL